MSFFQALSTLPEDPIFSLMNTFAKNSHPQKVNLGIGIYKDGEGRALPFRAIKQAEKELLAKNLGKEYLPIDGDANFNKVVLDLIFGTKNVSSTQPNIYAAQTIGGTGALRIGAELFSRQFSQLVFIPEISWPNHPQIFQSAGMQVHTYPYSISEKGELNFDALCHSIEKMPPGSLVLLHACCHNPTGVDISFEQWKVLAALIAKHKLFPFFDFAYHGFGVSLDDDAAAVRYFLAQGLEMMVAYSCSKTFGLYGERVGLIAVVTKAQNTNNVASHIKAIVRSTYSNPPIHGSRLVAAVLQSEDLHQEWDIEMNNIRKRCQAMRTSLTINLANTHRDFSFLNDQKGLFSFLGLTKDEVLQLQEQFGIIMPNNGRINIAALTESNIGYVCQALNAVI